MTAKSKPKNDCLLEADEQIKLVAYLRKANILHYAVKNDGKKSFLSAARDKKLGLVAGVPDLVIPIARNGKHGLYIELKREKGGVVSDYQRSWIDRLILEGYEALVCYGADEAIMRVESYFNGRE